MFRLTTRNGERGQAVILATMSLVVTLGVVGFVVDVGWAYFRKVAAKTAAEAAATAAVAAASSQTGFTCGLNVPCPAETACTATPTSPPSDYMQSGCLFAMKNGYVNSGRQYVTYEANTTSYLGMSPAYRVSFTVTEDLPQLFSAVLGQRWARVAAKATTGIFLQPQGACIYSLKPTGKDGIWGNGTMNVDSSCGLYVNSNDTCALEAKGGANFNMSAAKVVGGFCASGGGTVSPSPQINQPTILDPFASVPWPTPPDMTCDSMGLSGDQNVTVQADGWYVICGDISITGNKTQTYGPGKYYLKNGGMDLNNGHIIGNGVTFFLSATGYEGVSIAGNMEVQLAAPSTGAYRGMLMFQDRAVPTTGPESSFLGGSDQIINGSLYFSTTNLHFGGGSTTQSNYTGMVGYTIEFKGNSHFTADTLGQHTGLGLPRIGMLE